MSKAQSYEINLQNGSNKPISISLAGVDYTGRLSFDGERDNLRLEPDAKEVVQLQVEMKNRPLVGATYFLPFEVRISIDDLPPEVKMGQFEVRPLLPIWIFLLLPLLALCLLLLLILIIWPPDQPPTPTPITQFIEVTRVVSEEVPVEVTRIITEMEEVIVTEEVVVTQEVLIEKTRVVVEVEEIEVTRVVTETDEIEVTRVVEIFIPQPPPPTDGACVRINLEVGRDKERGTHGTGTYSVRELSGNVIATWHAVDGALDSGWINTAFISNETIYVEIFFDLIGNNRTIQLEIVNPAPGTSYGWLTRGICHAIEVQFPVEG